MMNHELTAAFMMLDATHSALLESEDAPAPRLNPYLTALVRAMYFHDLCHDLADAVNNYRADADDHYHRLLDLVELLLADLEPEVLT